MSMKEPGRDRTSKNRGVQSFRQWLAHEGRLPPSTQPRKQQKTPHRKHPAGPNVLWLMADQLRADTFGFANHPFIKTPNLDRLACQGMSLTRSYCASPVCMPSRATSLTGHYLTRHGVIQNGYRMNPTEVVFPTIVRESGYRTANIGKVHSGRSARETWEFHEHVQDAFGATKPSNVPFDPDVYPELKFVADEVCDYSDHVLYGRYPGPVPTTKSYQLATRAMNWLYWNDDERPFFLRVSFDDPHPPVVPPEPFYSMYAPEQVPDELVDGVAESLAGKPQVIRDYYHYTHHDRVSPHDHRKHAAVYCGLVSHLDAQMGRILDYLDELGWADNTIVILNSDHGHMIGEHGLTHKGGHVYEGVSRVPTVIRWPGHVEPGTSSDALMDGADFMPTVLDMLGIDAPAGLPGRSMVPVLTGADDAVRQHAFVQWDDYGFAVVGKRHKLVWWDCDSDGELYDLVDDPLEKVNLYHDPDCAARRDELLAVLDEWREQYAHSRRRERPAGTSTGIGQVNG